MAGDDTKLIGTFDGWRAYRFTDDARGPTCFMSRAPDKQEGKFKKRDTVLFFVTHWASEKEKNVVSVATGYAIKDKTPVTVAIKGKSFSLSPEGNMAWTKDAATDDALVKEINAGSSMTVKGISARGTEITDTYNLKGGAEAFKTIMEECKGTEKTK